MEKQDFLFSIIVPVYNTEKYINKCLESIKNAMDNDCEVIIINDGSKDKSEEKIIDFIEKLPETLKKNFIYKKKENKGLADTKNVGIDLARGKYISVVDSDDYISDDFYTIARKYINEENEIIIYDVYVEYEKNHKLNYVSRAKTDCKDSDIVALMNGAISGSSCNKIIKKDLYKTYQFPVGKEYEDTAVTPFILSDANKIKYIPYPLYHYTQREKSIVATNTLMSAFYKISSNITETLKNKNNDFEKYKYVINEFIVDRMLEMLTEDYYQNKKMFINNIKDFGIKNKQILKYIVDSDIINKVENHYSQRQKKLVIKIIQNILIDKFNNVKSIFLIRKIINKIRKIGR